jgi:hypothetical protein
MRRGSRIGKDRWPVRWAVPAIIGLSLIGWAAILVLLLLLWQVTSR